MEKEAVKKAVKENIEVLQNVLEDIIRPEFHEIKEMLTAQLNTLNENIIKDLDKL